MFFKKSKLKVNGKTKWFPRAVIVSKRPADLNELARRIAQMSTASTGDVHLVLRSLPSVMAQIMNEGRTVHIDGRHGSVLHPLCRLPDPGRTDTGLCTVEAWLPAVRVAAYTDQSAGSLLMLAREKKRENGRCIVGYLPNNCYFCIFN